MFSKRKKKIFPPSVPKSSNFTTNDNDRDEEGIQKLWRALPNFRRLRLATKKIIKVRASPSGCHAASSTRESGRIRIESGGKGRRGERRFSIREAELNPRGQRNFLLSKNQPNNQQTPLSQPSHFPWKSPLASVWKFLR